MRRVVLWGLFAGLLIGPELGLAGDLQVPTGYRFFTPRSRPSATARVRTEQLAGPRKLRQAGYSSEDGDQPAAPEPSPAGASPQAQTPASPPVTRRYTSAAQASPYSATNGFGYYFPGYTWVGADYSAFSYGVPHDWPSCTLGGANGWCGRLDTDPCFVRCERICPRYDCGYRPCWNDAGPTIFERRNKRGAWVDCFWQMGGWDCHHNPSCCTYPCPPCYCWPGAVASTRATPSQKVPTNYYDYNYSAPSSLPEPNMTYPSMELIAPTPFLPRDEPTLEPDAPQPSPPRRVEEPKPEPPATP